MEQGAGKAAVEISMDGTITLKFPPQPLHYVENIDTFHATRIEFKQGFPAGV